MSAASLTAQTESVYDACERVKAEISARDLPDVFDEDRCPVAGRVIVDGNLGAVVPQAGMAVTAEAASPEGDQHLTVVNPPGDEIRIEGAGQNDRAGASPSIASRASGPGACSDPYYSNRDSKLYNYNRWYVNGRSIPGYLSGIRAVIAMKRGAANISGVRDACGFGDGVAGRMVYQGNTRTSVDMRTNATCTSNDKKSVVGFGDLPSGFTAFACVWSWIQDGPNRVAQSDIRLNKSDHAWTTKLRRGCRGRYDIESSMTHERGHTFGLGEASESSHGNLTMSSKSNGTCQISERTLGRGDAIGLNNKYR